MICTRGLMMAIGLVLLVTGLASAQNRPNTLASKESREGWILLFDGQTLSGWEARPTSVPGSNGDWKVENGAIACGGATPSWLGTSEVYSDYVLKLEFRGGAKVNSGVFLRSQKEGEPHRTGYELQIWDYQPAGYNTGSLVGSAKAAETKIIADRWNRYEITADGDHFVIVLNGSTLLDTRNNAHASGVIGFQCQKDNPLEFRNIKVRPLKKAGATQR